MTLPDLEVDGDLLVLTTGEAAYALDIAGTPRQVGFWPVSALTTDVLAAARAATLWPEVELQLAGDDRPLPQHGSRWTGCGSSWALTSRGHSVDRTEDGGLHLVVTAATDAVEVDLHLLAHPRSSCLTRWTTTRALRPVAVDHVSSAVLRGLGRHGDFDALWLHTYDGGWCWEGALRSRPVTALSLYPVSCINAFAVDTVGSWSSKHLLPFYGIEDRTTGIAYGVQVDSSSSWRMEVGADAGTLYTQAGGPNQAGGHGRVVLAKGEQTSSPPVVLGVAEGDHAAVVDVFHRHRYAHQAPQPARRGVIYNEYHATMNTLDASTVRAQTAALEGTGVETFVLDAGWYSPQTPEGDVATWWTLAGDWEIDRSRFPDGLEALVGTIKAAGLVPGIWLEPEVAGTGSRLAAEHPEWLLHKDGVPLLDASRAFLDLRLPAVREHLLDVLGHLVAAGFAYVKFDYNTEVVPGPDAAPHGAGQGALDLAAGWQAVLDELRARHPHLVMESCASGGGRTDYGLLSRAHLGSVSDHGHWEGGWRSFTNVLRMVLDVLHPSQAVSWAVLEPGLSLAETRYRLATGLLGRMTVSGQVDGLTAEQHDLLVEAVVFADRNSDLLDGCSVRRHGDDQPLHLTAGILGVELFGPEGCLLGVWRQDTDRDTLTLQPHGLEAGRRYVVESFPAGRVAEELVGGDPLTVSLAERFDGLALAVRPA